MNITKISDGAYFVPSYSMQTITAGYDDSCSLASFVGSEDKDEAVRAVPQAPPVRELPRFERTPHIVSA